MFSLGRGGMTCPEELGRVEPQGGIVPGSHPYLVRAFASFRRLWALHTRLTPLLCHLLDPPQQHLPKPTRLFDLAEDGLHGLLAQPISTATTTPSQLHLHGSCSSPVFA
jgi:hypothetical protein